MSHSERHMGARKHKISLIDPQIIDLDADAMNRKLMPNTPDSYLNKDLLAALELPMGKSLLVRRNWETRSSASPTASHIKDGKIPGPFQGADNLFHAKTVADIREEGMWTVKVWPKYTWLGF